MSRIIYVAPRTKTPVGGIRTLFRHVARLRHHGFEAYLYHVDNGYRPDWFHEPVPMLYTADLRTTAGLKLRPDDHIVLYEAAANSIRFFNQYKGATRHLFCQNHFMMFNAPDELNVATWQELGVISAFASAHVIARAVKACLGFAQVPVTPYALDHARFRPRPKRLQIAYMPRKRPGDAAFIRRCFAGAFPDLARIAWIEIQGQSEDRVAELMGESAVFLSLSWREGFGLPPLEAMACGCLVAGFLGGGGVEFGTAENGLWCDDDDLFGAAMRLGEAVRGIEAQSPALAAMIEAGRRTAAGYTIAAMDAALVDYWRLAAVNG
jgi:glycosyltransferase involved in cell wall biosynthesis